MLKQGRQQERIPLNFGIEGWGILLTKLSSCYQLFIEIVISVLRVVRFVFEQNKVEKNL